jgi:hypothetical protein
MSRLKAKLSLVVICIATGLFPSTSLASSHEQQAIADLVERITVVESGNNCQAKNPLSTQAGLGQFIESTWLTLIATYRPDLIAGRSRQELLDLRFQCDLAREMLVNQSTQNANFIKGNGFEVTPGHLYLAHFLGPDGLMDALKADSSQTVLEVFGPAVIHANPFLEGKSIGWLMEWAERKMTQKR